MITIDTHIVIGIDNETVTVQCPFNNAGPWKVSVEEIGVCEIGEVLSTESGGWDILRREELDQLNEEGWKMLEAFLKSKNMRLSDLVFG